MAPLKLDPHSCRHCQRLVFNSRQTQSGGMDRLIFDFDLTIAEMEDAASNGCSFSKWLFETEWKTSVEIRDRLKISISTLRRRLASEQNTNIDHVPLSAYATGSSTANGFDIQAITWFGLRSGKGMSIPRFICQTLNYGFRVYTTSENPAATTISMRPIEVVTASDENFHRAASWLKTCLDTHRFCTKPAKCYMPTRLIEIMDSSDDFTIRLRLTKGSESEPYIALSYCWGGAQAVKCMNSLIDQWLVSISRPLLPQTIQDSIIVCRRLGVRFLWIDSLCIIQDNASDKAYEIAQMPQIYRNATLTIAAARARNVHEGFLEERVAPRFIGEVFELPYICPDNQLGSIILCRSGLMKEPLDERAWALQERLLSPRTLEYGTRQLRWICQENEHEQGYTDGWTRDPEDFEGRIDRAEYEIFREDSDTPQSMGSDIRDEMHKRIVEDWYRVVTVYSNRELTVSTDRILAISGIAELYGRRLDDVYLAGLWKSTLLSAMLWQTVNGKSTARPREYQGPSWSWTAVNAPLDFSTTYDILARATYIIRVEFVGCSVQLMDDNAPYGAICEGSGRLALKGRMLPVTYSPAIRKAGDYGQVLNTIEIINANGESHKIEVHIDASEPKTDDKTSPECEVMLLEFLSGRNGQYLWDSRGLVLRRLKGEIFSRLGVFWYTTHRGRHESLEEWIERSDRDYDWFKDCIPTVVEII